MRFKPHLVVNPIIVKELRSRMRGPRAFIMLTAMLLLLGTASYALYRLTLATSRYSSTPLSPQIGQTLFAMLAFLELMVICIITPAITAGAISSEREKLTFEMLLATPLRPLSILWGKLVSSLSYIFLLLFAALPMASLVFIFGGVALGDMIRVLVVLMAVGVTLGVIGIFMSAWLGRTGRATAASYLVVLALLAGTLLAFIFAAILYRSVPPREILVINPVSALFSALMPSLPTSGSLEVFGGLGMILGGNAAFLNGEMKDALIRPLYHYSLVSYAGITLVLYLLATRLVRPTQRWRLSRKELVALLAICFFFGGAAIITFGATSRRYVKMSALLTPTPMPMAVPVMPEPMVVEKEVVRVVPMVPAATPTPTPTPLPVPTEPSAFVSPLPAPSLPLSEEDQVAIYAAVVRQLYTVDHTFGNESPNFPVVYLLQTTNDELGAPDAPQTEPYVLPEAVQAAVIDRLTDLPAKFQWVENRDQVPVDDHSSVEGGGAIFTLGNIHIQQDGSVLVSASLYFAMLGAGGRTYILQPVDGVWQIIGNTGVEWMS